jgi:hypothetical protein
LIPRALRAKYVTGFDLKGFFNLVNVKFISEELRKLQTPEHIVSILEDQMMSPIKSIDRTPPKPQKARDMFASWMSMKPMIEIKHIIAWKGVPQGAATSPILSSLVTRATLFRLLSNKLDMYADDGIICSEKPIELPLTQDMKIAGVNWNHDKTEIIKEKGRWQKDMKFLGLTYLHMEDKLMAETKKGSRLKFEREDLVGAVAAAEKGNKRYIPGLSGKWTDFVQSRILGFIQARLYAGSFDLENIEQDFRYSSHYNSW